MQRIFINVAEGGNLVDVIGRPVGKVRKLDCSREWTFDPEGRSLIAPEIHDISEILYELNRTSDGESNDEP